VQALDAAGLLLHLHKETLAFEKDGVKVAIHGMSNVPERFASQALRDWNPRPVAGAHNVLVIHQNVAPYVYSPLEPPSISLEDLPRGFDMILDGHIHTKVIDKAGESLFMILGSTVTTQFDKKEAGSVKGFHKMEFLPGRKPSVEFVQLDRARKFFYYELTNENVEMMREQIDATLSDIAAIRHPKRPVVKFKILGSDTRPVDHDLAMLQRKYSDKIILSFVKQLESEDMAEKLEMVRGLRDERLSVEEVGLDMLRKSMEAMGFKPGFSPEDMFAMLSRGDTEKALAVLTDDHKALYELSRR
jgi:DNA repair exonuclease SbcCD nuclease subunit